MSVIVPTIDRSEKLARALRAILDQEYAGPIEVVVVFDRLQPNESLGTAGNKRSVRVISNDRAPGAGGARNAGILSATADFIAFCDDDDVWHRTKLRKQIELLQAEPDVGMVVCGFRARYGEQVHTRLPARAELEHDDFVRSRVLVANSSSLCARTDAIIGGAGLIDERMIYSEDYDWMLSASAATRIRCIPEALVDIEWGSESHFHERWDTWTDSLEYLLRKRPELAGRGRGPARLAGQVAFAYAAMNARKEASRWIARTLRSWPVEPRAFLAGAVALGVVSPGTVLRFLRRRGRGI